MITRKNMLAFAMLGCLGAFDYGKVYAEEPRRTPTPTPTPQPEPKNFDPQLDSQLAAKGLQRFEINGKVIFAHNEKEAQKRYRKRYK